MVQQMRAIVMAADEALVEGERINAIGRLKGSGGGKSLLFNGRVDTNPATAGWTVDPWGGVVDENFNYGIGVSNMKAGDAMYFCAVKTLVEAGVKLRGDVILTFVVGKLQGGVGTVAFIDQGLRAGYCGGNVDEDEELAPCMRPAAGLHDRARTAIRLIQLAIAGKSVGVQDAAIRHQVRLRTFPAAIARIMEQGCRCGGAAERPIIADIDPGAGNVIEAQGTATTAIARNVQQAAQAAHHVTLTIDGVSRAANETGAAAGNVLSDAGEVSGQAQFLSGEVSRFVASVRAA
jgi:hypothetical protein